MVEDALTQWRFELTGPMLSIFYNNMHCCLNVVTRGWRDMTASKVSLVLMEYQRGAKGVR